MTGCSRSFLLRRLIALIVSTSTSTSTSAFLISPPAVVHQQHARVELRSSSKCMIHSNPEDGGDVVPQHESSRRQALRSAVQTTLAVVSSSLLLPNIRPAMAADVASASEEGLIDVYFGCGCFWHVQHEFVEAEKKILGRKDDQLTARTGYAGGKAGMLDGKVCYHNALGQSDYGKLGHSEVVGLKIPPSKFEAFCIEYFNLFDAKGDRPDQGGDRGSEYRSLVGLPGGSKGEYAKTLIAASIATGDKLDFAYGKGDDKDVRKTSFVMDTADYPFYVAEQYHQFHDGFAMGENYPGSYNKLADAFAKAGEDFGTCPNGGILGIGGL